MNPKELYLYHANDVRVNSMTELYDPKTGALNLSEGFYEQQAATLANMLFRQVSGGAVDVLVDGLTKELRIWLGVNSIYVDESDLNGMVKAAWTRAMRKVADGLEPGKAG